MTKERSLPVVMHAAVVSIDLFPRITPWQITSPPPSTNVTYPTARCIYLHLVHDQHYIILYIQTLLCSGWFNLWYNLEDISLIHHGYSRWQIYQQVLYTNLIVLTCHGHFPCGQMASFWSIFPLLASSDKPPRCPHGSWAKRMVNII